MPGGAGGRREAARSGGTRLQHHHSHLHIERHRPYAHDYSLPAARVWQAAAQALRSAQRQFERDIYRTTSREVRIPSGGSGRWQQQVRRWWQGRVPPNITTTYTEYHSTPSRHATPYARKQSPFFRHIVVDNVCATPRAASPFSSASSRD